MLPASGVQQEHPGRCKSKEGGRDLQCGPGKQCGEPAELGAGCSWRPSVPAPCASRCAKLRAVAELAAARSMQPGGGPPPYGWGPPPPYYGGKGGAVGVEWGRFAKQTGLQASHGPRSPPPSSPAAGPPPYMPGPRPGMMGPPMGPPMGMGHPMAAPPMGAPPLLRPGARSSRPVWCWPGGAAVLGVPSF